MMHDCPICGGVNKVHFNGDDYGYECNCGFALPRMGEIEIYKVLNICQEAYGAGYEDGHEQGVNDGYCEGYDDGQADSESRDSGDSDTDDPNQSDSTEESE